MGLPWRRVREFAKLSGLVPVVIGKAHCYEPRALMRAAGLGGSAKPALQPEQREHEGKPAGFVYFARDEATGHIKIGRSCNPEKRMTELACGSPGRIVLLGCVDGAHREAEFHARFSEIRVRDTSEWFHPSPVLLEFIQSVATMRRLTTEP
jgi:hypothetical protein